MSQTAVILNIKKPIFGTRTRAIVFAIVRFSAISLIPKLLALFKDMAVAARFGASHVLDIYLMAYVLIGVPVSVIAIAFQTVLIPSLVEKNDEEASSLLGQVIKLVLILLTVALPIWLIILPKLFSILYPQTPDDSRKAILEACMWLIPYYFINGINILLYGALQARKSFWPNALLPALFPFAILAALWLVPEPRLGILLGGTVAGSGAEGLLLLSLLRKAKLIQCGRELKTGVMKLSRLAAPIVVAGIVSSFGPVLEQLIAFRLGEGAVSLLSYGFKVPAALSSLFVTAIGVVVLPHFSEIVVQKSWDTYRTLYLWACTIVILWGLAITGVCVILSGDIVRLLFQRGEFQMSHTIEATKVMRMYLFQFPLLLMLLVSQRALVAIEKTLAIGIITITQVIVSGLFSYWLSVHMGVSGVALGTTIGTFIATTLSSLAVLKCLNRLLQESKVK